MIRKDNRRRLCCASLRCALSGHRRRGSLIVESDTAQEKRLLSGAQSGAVNVLYVDVGIGGASTKNAFEWQPQSGLISRTITRHYI